MREFRRRSPGVTVGGTQLLRVRTGAFRIGGLVSMLTI